MNPSAQDQPKREWDPPRLTQLGVDGSDQVKPPDTTELTASYGTGPVGVGAPS